MTDQMSMDDILNPPKQNIKETVKEAVKEVQQEAVQVETKEVAVDPANDPAKQSIRKRHRDKEQEAQGRVRDPETGQYAAKQEKGDIKPEVKDEKPAEKQEVKQEEKKLAAPQQEFTDKEKAFLRAAEEERRKRQELERRLAELEKAKPQPDPKEPAKTFWDDPEGTLARDRESLKAEISREMLANRLITSEMLAKRKYEDFDTKIKVFGEIMQKTPGLYQQFITNPDPGEFAYGTAKQHIELQEAGSIDALRSKIEKEVRIKMEAELKEKAEALAKEKAALPGSLSDAPAKGTNRQVWGGPPSMDSILRGDS